MISTLRSSTIENIAGAKGSLGLSNSRWSIVYGCPRKPRVCCSVHEDTSATGGSVAENKLGLSTGWLMLAIVSAIAVAVGTLAFAASVGTGFWSYLLSGVGSALLSTAVALLISEIVLKPLLVRDLLSMTHLRDRVADIAMRDLGPSSRVDWRELYESSREIDIVVDAPSAWVERDLELVVACASRKCRVRIFLPPPEGTLEGQVVDAESSLREAWTRRQDDSSKAVLEVWFLKEKPTSFMSRFDGEVVLAVDAGLSVEVKSKLYLHVGTAGTSDVQTWIKDRWQWAEAGIDGTVAWNSPKLPLDPAVVREGLRTKLNETEVNS